MEYGSIQASGARYFSATPCIVLLSSNNKLYLLQPVAAEIVPAAIRPGSCGMCATTILPPTAKLEATAAEGVGSPGGGPTGAGKGGAPGGGSRSCALSASSSLTLSSSFSFLIVDEAEDTETASSVMVTVSLFEVIGAGV